MEMGEVVVVAADLVVPPDSGSGTRPRLGAIQAGRPIPVFGGTVLDPFAGSGSTLVAATLEGFDSIGVEAEAEYLPLIEGRVRWAESQVEQPALSFD